MTESKKKISLVFATILLFAALVVLILYVIPKINQLKELSKQVQSKQIEYETGKAKVENATTLSSLISQYKQQANLLGVALPSTSKAEDALVELSSTADASGVSITSADVQSDNKGSLQVNLSIRGGYQSSVTFLGKLKDNIRPIKVINMTMTKVDNDILTDFTLVFPYFSSGTTPSASNSEATK